MRTQELAPTRFSTEYGPGVGPSRKVSDSMPAGRIAAVKARIGAHGFSAYISAAVGRQLQRGLLEEQLLEELEDTYVLPYVYRITKYDPADRDEHGHYTGSMDTVSDHGQVEDAYLQAIAAFAADTGVNHLAIREPGVPSLAHFGVERPLDGFGLIGLFPADLTGFHDGARVPLGIGLELVRVILRESGAWCRLEAEGAFAVHVGWDQYLYIGTSRPCPDALSRTRALGLFPERVDASPYDMETGGEEVQRPGDDEFWTRLHWAVAEHPAVILEETYIEGPSRWHRVTADTIDTVRAGITPRARLAVWPDLSSDVAAVLGALPDEGLVECVWQERDGRIRSILVDESEFPQLTAEVSHANAAALLSGYAEGSVPLFTAVMPDSDGVVRARWRTEPTPSDRNWASSRLSTEVRQSPAG